ncbi:MAG: CoA transferase subunit A [Betaproteobacteria bacterium]|nr:CoA transferase subunit A [Betaproteobacteria bacterium]
MNDVLSSIEDIAARIPDGARLAVSQDSTGVSMAATRALVRRGARDLKLVCVPISGLQADVLIGAGCVSTVETSAVTLGEFGTGPRFAAALKNGSIRVLDATCPAIHAALQAGQKGLPFIPLRGLIGTDVLARRDDWKVIDNPFSSGDPIALLPAIRPDAALFHAPMADRNGNVFIGRNRDLLTMAQASHECFVTVEKIVDEDLMADPARSPGVIPAIYVSGVAIAERGAAPLRFLDDYPADETVLSDYARMGRTDEGFRTWLARWLGPADLSTAA